MSPFPRLYDGGNNKSIRLLHGLLQRFQWINIRKALSASCIINSIEVLLPSQYMWLKVGRYMFPKGVLKESVKCLCFDQLYCALSAFLGKHFFCLSCSTAPAELGSLLGGPQQVLGDRVRDCLGGYRSPAVKEGFCFSYKGTSLNRLLSHPWAL